MVTIKHLTMCIMICTYGESRGKFLAYFSFPVFKVNVVITLFSLALRLPHPPIILRCKYFTRTLLPVTSYDTYLYMTKNTVLSYRSYAESRCSAEKKPVMYREGSVPTDVSDTVVS